MTHNYWQREAGKAGVPENQKRNFHSKYQVEAYKAGVKSVVKGYPEALKFFHKSQVDAYKAGITKINQALKFMHSSQVEAYKAGAPAKQALKVINDDQLSKFIEDMNHASIDHASNDIGHEDYHLDHSELLGVDGVNITTD